MDSIIKDCKDKTKKMYVGHKNLYPVFIRECAFADDVVIFAEKEKDLEHNLATWKDALSKRNLNINESKTKIMIINARNTNMNITLNGKVVEKIETFKYLGVPINNKGNQEAEIVARMEGAARMYHAIRSNFLTKREVSRHTKISVYKSIFVPILTFGSESWVLSKKLKSKVQSIAMKFLRTILGITRIDRIRNTTVREELGVESVLSAIEKAQLRWYGHLLRMKEDRPTRNIWEAKMQGRRVKGRPMKTWDKNIEDLLRERGVTSAAAKTLAQDRKMWKTFVHKRATEV